MTGRRWERADASGCDSARSGGTSSSRSSEAEPGRRIAWKSVQGVPFDLTVTLDLEPIGPASTKASYGADIRLHGLWRLLSPMVAMEANAGPARELSRLKAQVEAAPAMAPATS